MTVSHMVNSMYPLSYFGLDNTDRIKYPDQYWWSSKQRFAAVDGDQSSVYLPTRLGGKITSEYLEIDLGRVREINWLDFQILQVPVNITIEYDALSDNEGDHNWVPIVPAKDMSFDSVVHYNANSRSAFQDAQFYFTNAQGSIVVTRFLRIRFVRRDEAWPTKQASPFRWAVMVKGLRTARYIATTLDSIGPLFDMGAGDTEIGLTPLPSPSVQSRPILQQFQYPSDFARGNITPRLLGFGFVADIAQSSSGDLSSSFFNDITQVSFQWSLSDSTGTVLAKGVQVGVPAEGKVWVDVFLEENHIFTPDPLAQYTVSISSVDLEQCTSIFVATYANLSPIPGGIDAQIVNADQTTRSLTGQVLAMRLWGDVADNGRDVLGNQYRYASFYEAPGDVFDDTQVGWTSAPRPSPNAIEALYFDVRTVTSGVPSTSVIDAVQVDPRTQGLIMHVYYTEQSRSLKAPKNSADYDNLMWTPVNVTYHLQGSQTFLLPQPIRASYIKLEFSKLQPLPWRVPTHPALPPQQYRRYPTWIEQQFANASVKKTVNDWFLQQKPVIRQHILQNISDPVLAFEYKERAFLAALTTGDLSKKFANSALVDPQKKVLIDPTTGSKVYLSGSELYNGTLLVNVDRDSVLGQFVSDAFDINSPGTIETPTTRRQPGVPLVSTSNDRISESFAMLSQTPMWFNRVCRHQYMVESGQFNRKAYFASIRQVQFYRKDYTVARDDPVIVDNLVDNHNLLTNTFVQDIPSALLAAIEAASPGTPVQVYVSYVINDVPFTDGPLVFSGTTDIIPLSQTGGVATNVVMTTGPNGTGSRYRLGVDFDISLSTDSATNATVNNVQPYSLNTRLVPQVPAALSDSAIITGVGIVSGTDLFVPGSGAESNVVVGVGLPSGLEHFVGVDTATIFGVGTVRSAYAHDENTIPGTGDLGLSIETYVPVGSHIYTDSATVTGVGNVSATSEFGVFRDAQTILGTGLPSGLSGAIFMDGPITLPSEGGVMLDLGYQLGAVNINTVTATTLYPNALGAAVYVPWSSLQPIGPNALDGWNTPFNSQTIDQILDNAAANGYQLAFRVGAGGDVPNWLTHAGVIPTPAQTLDLIATTNGVSQESVVPLPWDPALQQYYGNLLTLLAQKFHPTAASGLTAAGTRRSHQVMYTPVTMPMVDTITMTTEYGAAATYTGAATLTSTISSSQTNVTLTGGAAYPASNSLLKVENELMLITAFNSGTGVMTVTRGYSGTTGATHAAGLVATHSSAGTFSGVYAGVNSTYDIQAVNQKQWLTVGTLATNQANLTGAWQSAINLMYQNFTSITSIPSSVTYGDMFGDLFQNAAALATTNSSLYCWTLLSNLQPGNDGAGGLTKVNAGITYPTYFQGFSPAEAQVAIQAEGGVNSVLGFNTATLATFNTFTNPFNGSASAFRTILEEALTTYGMTVVEVTTDLIATNAGSDSTANYLF